MKYVLGIDSGATKSEAFILPLNSTEKKGVLKKYASINLNVLGYDESAKRLIGIVKDCSKGKSKADIVSVAAGISGARSEKDRKRLGESAINATGIKNIRVYGDTETAFASAFDPGDKNCGILIAGTGSILYYIDRNGKLIRIGGWGRHIGDEGSGHWIAREALYKVTRYYDGRAVKTKLVDILKREFCIDSTNIIQEVYINQFEISKITRHVFRAAEKGDKVSIEILKNAAENLLTHFIPLKNRKCKIALMGSLFTEEKLLAKYLSTLAKNKFMKIDLFRAKYKPVWGAVKLALANSK